jgi:hypothetical protein
MLDYLAGGQTWWYPKAGDPSPPDNTKVLILTRGGVAVIGVWQDDLAWLPLPKCDKEKEDHVKRIHNT